MWAMFRPRPPSMIRRRKAPSSRKSWRRSAGCLRVGGLSARAHMRPLSSSCISGYVAFRQTERLRMFDRLMLQHDQPQRPAHRGLVDAVAILEFHRRGVGALQPFGGQQRRVHKQAVERRSDVHRQRLRLRPGQVRVCRSLVLVERFDGLEAQEVAVNIQKAVDALDHTGMHDAGQDVACGEDCKALPLGYVPDDLYQRPPVRFHDGGRLLPADLGDDIQIVDQAAGVQLEQAVVARFGGQRHGFHDVGVELLRLHHPLPVLHHHFAANIIETMIVLITHTDRTRKRREIATLLLVMLGGIAAVLWYATPRMPTVSIGRVEDFPPRDRTYYIIQGDFQAWAANTGDEILIFEPHTPHHTYVPCRWVARNQRFEDPMTGSKLTPTGEWIEGPAPRHLARCAGRTAGGEIQAEAWRVIHGAERQDR